MLLLVKADQIADHKFAMEQVLTGAAEGAILLLEERDIYKLAPEPVD